MPDLTDVQLAWFAVGLGVGVVVGLAIAAVFGWRPKRRRKRPAVKSRPVTPVGERPQDISGDLADPARMTPAEAMAHAAPVDVPDDLAQERFDHTTAKLLQSEIETIAIAVPEPEPVALPAVTEPWRPPEPRVVLTLAWKRPDAPLVAGRYDITDEMPDDVAPLYHAMRRQRSFDGGTITVAVKLDGRHHPDWEWQADDEWPRESIDAIRQARTQLQAVNA